MSRFATALDDIQALTDGIPLDHPVGCFWFVSLPEALDDARGFLGALDITSVASVMNASPPVIRTLALTHAGLAAAGVARSALQSFPPEFAEGMPLRARGLGDVGESDPEKWEPLWKPRHVHAWIGTYAVDEDTLRDALDQLGTLTDAHGVTVLGHQDVKRLIFEPGHTRLYLGEQPDITRDNWVHEHFGFADGVSNPPILGLDPDREYPGRGKQDKPGGPWRALAAGEFVLGCADEAGELATRPQPVELAANGSFMVYRKLEQDVPGFHAWLREQAESLGTDPDRIAEKMVGRHRDGRPLVTPRGESLNNYLYADDPDGLQCPLGAHARRTNPRDQLGFGTPLVNRHRVLRRAITYGDYLPPRNPDKSAGKKRRAAEKAERGLAFISLGRSIADQFEFVQRQWVNIGNELGQGNTRDPVIGNHSGRGGMVIPGRAGEPTVVCSHLPRFVTTRGGDYFFLPGLLALRLIIDGAFSSVPRASGVG